VDAQEVEMSQRVIEESRIDRILTATRILAAIIVPVLAAAFLMLYLFPSNSGGLFAWPIKPAMSAMMLGATYLGGAFFFTLLLITKEWHTVRLGLIPVAVFAGILGISTTLHWDKFTQGHVSFILWAILYFVLPFVIPVVWYLNERASRGYDFASEARFPNALRVILGGTGVVMLAASALLLLFPDLMIPTWPWTLTPLTARVLSAMFSLPGLVSIGTARDGHMSSARIIFSAQVVSIGLILLALLVNRGEIDWSKLSVYTFIGGLLLTLGLITWAMTWAQRQMGNRG